MTENEILLKGIVIGASAIIPFIGIALGKWHHWKAEYKFSKMMHDDAMAQNERLFRAVKSEEDKAKYFESKLKFVIEQYKPIGHFRHKACHGKIEGECRKIPYWIRYVGTYLLVQRLRRIDTDNHSMSSRQDEGN